MDEHHKRITHTEVHRFIVDAFRATGGTNASHAGQMADALVAADNRGHHSHGLSRLRMYLMELRCGTADGLAVPRVLRESAGTAWVDGRNGLGMVVGNWCMDLAIAKARGAGIGLVCCKHSNHYGSAGWYSMRAEREGMIGWSATNSSPVMAPTRSRQPAMGTNPIAFAAPASDGRGLHLDMATTTAALGKIEVCRRKGVALPLGWAQDAEGRPTTDAKVACAARCLMPLGGAEETGGYKGYGLAAMCEVMCGVLPGAAFGTNVRPWALDGGTVEANLGHMFMAVDPQYFAEDFAERMTELNGMLRGLRPMDPAKPVLVPGDPERTHEDTNRRCGGIVYHSSQIEECKLLARELNIKPMIYLEEV